MVEPTAPIPAPTADGVAEHHGVRFERSDIEPRGVVAFGVGLVVALVLISLILWGLFAFLADRAKAHNTKDQLPQAAVDDNRLPPQPRLEEIDDLREGKLAFRPARAKQYRGRQETRLEEGDPAQGAIKIDDAIKAVAGKLPVRKTAPHVPAGSARPPARAASGRPSSEKGGP
jgi:hypothetical protein